jgi:hypothetical protein
MASKKADKAAPIGALIKTGQTTTTAAAKRCEELLALIERRTATIAESFYDIGEALREIHHKALHAALGFKSFEAMLERRSGIGRSQAYKLMAIARSLPRSRALAMGTERAYALAALAHASAQPDTAASLLDTGLTVGGKRVDLSQLSARQLHSITREVRPRSSASVALAEAKREGDALARLVKKRDRQATVQVRRSGGRMVAVVTIELAALGAWARG